jgi:hypothetical protein
VTFTRKRLTGCSHSSYIPDHGSKGAVIGAAAEDLAAKAHRALAIRCDVAVVGRHYNDTLDPDSNASVTVVVKRRLPRHLSASSFNRYANRSRSTREPDWQRPLGPK